MGFHDFPNTQSKAPTAGSKGPVGQRQTIDSGGHDDPAGFLGGVGDEGPGKTQRLDDCLTQGQDSGSNQARVPSGGNLNVGASGEGKSAIDGTSPEYRSTKAQGQQPTPGRGELPVSNGMLFPGIIE